MTTGVEIYNDSESLTIDGNTKVLAFSLVMPVTPADIPTTFQDVGCRIDRVGFFTNGAIENSVIACRCTSGYAAVLNKQFFTDSGTGLPAVFFDLAAWDGVSAEYYFFPRPNLSLGTVPAHGFGMQVFDDAGSLVFTTDARPMRIVGITGLTNAPLINVGATPTVIDVGVASKYAAIISQPRYATHDWIVGTKDYTATFVEAVTVTSTGASTTGKPSSAADNGILDPIRTSQPYGGQLVLVDVSGILP